MSISLLLGSAGGAATDRWPLVLLGPPVAEPSNSSGSSSSSSSNAAAALLAPVGGAIIFLGRDFLHWRPCCLAPDEAALVLLAHYVPADFPEAPVEK